MIEVDALVGKRPYYDGGGIVKLVKPVLTLGTSMIQLLARTRQQTRQTIAVKSFKPLA